MYSLRLVFSHPWFLLFLIPAFALTLIPYFLLNKRYRRTRNRITSIVLHLLIMVLCISVFAGLTFEYTIPNDSNEIMMVVDVSDSEKTEAENRDLIVKTIIDRSKIDNIRVGIVLFGFDQQYALPLTNNYNDAFEKYTEALENINESIDTTATDLAKAVLFSKDQITHPETSKIVLITDGKETDESVVAVLRNVMADGIKLDTAYISAEKNETDIQVVNLSFPEYHVKKDEECEISFDVYSVSENSATAYIIDNGVKDESSVIDIDLNVDSTQTFKMKHTFSTQGLHEVTCVIENDSDGIVENNAYSSYYCIENFNKVLLIERVEGESQAFKDMLLLNKNNDNENAYDLTLMQIDSDILPKTIEDLLQYDEILLDNIANSDMPEGFDELLNSYVYDYGGGLFTSGGSVNKEAHAYNRVDMGKTLFQKMLPVQAIKYTPPVGLVIIIDRSGSMTDSAQGITGSTKFEAAVDGAYNCLEALSDRDYFSIMTLDSDSNIILPLTPKTQEAKIRKVLSDVLYSDADGGTIFTGPIIEAGKMLKDTRAEKKHIIIVTDGDPTEPSDEDYINATANNYANGITLSIVGIGMSRDAQNRMENLAGIGGGKSYNTNGSKLVELLRQDLLSYVIEETSEVEFIPTVNKLSSQIMNGIETSSFEDIKADMKGYSPEQLHELCEHENGRFLNVVLGGFYGTRAKEGADVILTGQYDVPLYAQWKYGKGTVGSFLSDLNGTSWSSAFLADNNCNNFIYNAIDSLMPTQDIRPKSISYEIKEDNYTNQLSIYSDLLEGERIEAELEYKGNKISLNEITDRENNPSVYTVSNLSKENEYSRSSFIAKGSGIYTLTITKFDQNNNVLAKVVGYKSLAYSEEYDTVKEYGENELEEFLTTLAERTGGSMIENIEDPYEVFLNFVTELTKTFDPRYLFIILSIIMFLLDIAVRKFKFKWIHEIIRERKEKEKV